MSCRLNDLSGAIRVALSLGAAAALGIGGFAFAASPAAPQQRAATAPAKKPQTLQTVQVTGSHIRAAALATANPVITVSSQQIRQTGDLTLGAVIQNLPAITGPITSPNINNAGFNPGATRVGLRGLGASRTLLLIDGQRVINNDLNAIPAEAVDRIEVLTDGASTVYGSDAIGGVINAILKRNYQGAQFQANYGISDHNDGERKGYSFMFGQSSDKGSILAGVSYNKTDAIPESARKISDNTVSITGSTNTPVRAFFGGSSFTPRSDTQLPPNLRARFGCDFVSLNQGAVGQSAPTTLADYHCYDPAQDSFSFSDYRPLTTPQERTNAFVNGVYHLTPNVNATLTVLHNKADSGFQLGPPVWATNSGLVLSHTACTTRSASATRRPMATSCDRDWCRWETASPASTRPPTKSCWG